MTTKRAIDAEHLDPATLTAQQIIDAVRTQGRLRGAKPEDIEDELARIQWHPHAVRVYRAVYGDGTKGPLCAFYSTDDDVQYRSAQ